MKKVYQNKLNSIPLHYVLTHLPSSEGLYTYLVQGLSFLLIWPPFLLNNHSRFGLIFCALRSRSSLFLES